VLTPREHLLLAERHAPIALTWAEPFHQAWMAHADAPRPLRLARAIRAQWGHSRPVIREHELVIGRFGIQSCVSWSEYGAVRFDGALWQRLRQEHEGDAEARGLLDEIRTEWEGRDFAGLVYRDWQALGLSGFIPGSGLGPWPGHACQEYRILLELGAVGLRERIARGQAANPGLGDWYDSLLEIVEGIGDFARALRNAALEAPAAGCRRAELCALAAILKRCPEQPCETFREALQTFWIAFYLNGADSAARLDQDLGPYLERDLAAGRITPDEARELVASLWARFDEYRSWSVVVGGVDREGRDASNTFTRLALEATERLKTQAPNLALRVHPDLPEDTLRLGCRIIAGGGGMPPLVNDPPIIAALQARGVSLEDARDYALTGCAQVIVPGRSYGGYEDILVNGLKWLEVALHNGFDPAAGRQAGPSTGEPGDFPTFGCLTDAWQAQMRSVLGTCVAQASGSLRVLAECFPSGYRSLLGYDTVERGVDVRAGGYRYSEGLADILGLTNLADSLAAIRELVYERQELTLGEFVAILDANWEGHEALRQRCLREFPKFGNQDPAHDAFVAEIHRVVLDELESRGYSLDVVGWTGHLDWGRQTLASADGRRAHEPLADSCGAGQGRDLRGPTAVCASAAVLPHERAAGVLALTLRFTSPRDRAAFEDSLVSLVRTYFQLGGQQLQINVVDNQVLRDAQAHPERYESLVVRVGGFSAYWNHLSPDMQEAIISRTEHVL
jgi:formate C-acetyltransferase